MTIIFLVATIVVAAGIRWNEQTWIDDRNFPGGPAAYLVAEFSIPLNVLDNSAYVVNNVLTDLLVVNTSIHGVDIFLLTGISFTGAGSSGGKAIGL